MRNRKVNVVYLGLGFFKSLPLFCCIFALHSDFLASSVNGGESNVKG